LIAIEYRVCDTTNKGVRKVARDGTEMRRKELEKNLKCILEVHSKSNYPFSLQCQTYLSLWERQSIQPTFAQCFMAVTQISLKPWNLNLISRESGEEKKGICRQRRDIAKGLGYRSLIKADVHP